MTKRIGYLLLFEKSTLMIRIRFLDCPKVHLSNPLEPQRIPASWHVEHKPDLDEHVSHITWPPGQHVIRDWPRRIVCLHTLHLSRFLRLFTNSLTMWIDISIYIYLTFKCYLLFLQKSFILLLPIILLILQPWSSPASVLVWSYFGFGFLMWLALICVEIEVRELWVLVYYAWWSLCWKILTDYYNLIVIVNVINVFMCSYLIHLI